ncbi:MAG: Coenzyme F420 hydrogenase/dehydrogenase, beta subunit C-terminal domain [Paludibacteraceae bacterium]|nr:Coenzyme F420 hydrogenase/dehydrogenase, beta subunit C-terminal domain [Paludibacteraceae bacterium]
MEKTDKIQLASIDRCTGCAACASACPTGSIIMRENKEGFLQPQIDAETCIKCHKCEKTCPVIKPIEIPLEFETQAYAAINKDEAVRMRSSSGGMFYALAKRTIEHRGVVFGARFDEKWDVVHDYTETLEGIEPFMRSKYVQSRIGETYKQAKVFLNAGRQVLFVGTPCQIGGLHAYLGKDYENLIMVDFICHGVPSPGVWRRYLGESFEGGAVQSFNFRDKTEGWTPNQCIVSVTTTNTTIVTEMATTTTTTTTTVRAKLMANPYFRGFRREIYLRRSCYDCQFRTYHRLSDFTLADFWGVQSNAPEMFDNKGTSIVFVHTKKANEVLQEVASSLHIKDQSKENAISGNRGMDRDNPQFPLGLRRTFYRVLGMSSFPKAIKVADLLYTVNLYSFRLKRKIKKLLKCN